MYDYKPLATLQKEFNCKDFPSPTKIFSTLNKTQSDFFRKAMKDKTSAAYQATQRGTAAHNAIETGNAKSLLEERILEEYNNKFLVDCDEIWAKEKGLVSLQHKFKGKFDAVGVFRGKPTIWDYKKTNKLKTKSQMLTYFKQAAAYVLAHNEMYNTEINQICIFNIAGKEASNISSQVLILDAKEYIIKFKSDLQDYYV